MHGSAQPKSFLTREDLCADAHWYAAYTRPQHERSVAEQAAAKGLEALVPMAPMRRSWKQRVVHLAMPLFPGYVFVHMQLDQRLQLLSIPSVVRLVSFSGTPATISVAEIEAIRTCMTNARGMRADHYLQAGCRVRIREGIMAGIEGVVVEQNSMHRLVISIRMLQLAFSIDVEADNLEPIDNA
jgi:transcription antitermination factor NusG